MDLFTAMRTFAEVAQAGSMNGAAQRLNVTSALVTFKRCAAPFIEPAWATSAKVRMAVNRSIQKHAFLMMQVMA